MRRLELCTSGHVGPMRSQEGRHWEPCAQGVRDWEGHRERAQAGDGQVVSAIRRSAKCAQGREGLVCGLAGLYRRLGSLRMALATV